MSYLEHSLIVQLNKIKLVNLDKHKDIIDEAASSRKSIIHEMIIRKALKFDFFIPTEILSIIKDFAFRSPIVFKQQIFRLIKGSKNYRKPNLWEYQQYEDYQQQKPKLTPGPELNFHINNSYELQNGDQFILQRGDRRVMCKVQAIWYKLKFVRPERIIQYTTTMLNFLDKFKSKSEIIANQEQKIFLKIHVENILRNRNYNDIEEMEFAVKELAKRDMIWLHIHGVNYLCFNSREEIRGVFKINNNADRWQFQGDFLNVWKSGIAIPRTSSLLRYTLFEVFYSRANQFSLCYEP